MFQFDEWFLSYILFGEKNNILKNTIGKTLPCNVVTYHWCNFFYIEIQCKSNHFFCTKNTGKSFIWYRKTRILWLDIRIIRCDSVYEPDYRCNLHELKWDRLNASIKEEASLNTTFFIASHDITKWFLVVVILSPPTQVCTPYFE